MCRVGFSWCPSDAPRNISKLGASIPDDRPRVASYRKTMLHRGFVILLAILAASGALGQSPKAPTIFDVNKERAQRAVVTAGETLPEFDAGAPMMLLALRGVLADLKGPKLDQLRATYPLSPPLGDAGNAERVCTIHLFVKPGIVGKRLAIFRDKAADFIAVELDANTPDRAQLKRDAFAALYFDWPNYRRGFTPEELKDTIGQSFDLPKPFTAGRMILDKKNVGDRFLSGGASKLETDRDLENEKFSVRLPLNYSAKSPAGLLVWINASNVGQTPPPFVAALDGLNIVCIGAAESGNTRQVTNRQQLALDGVASASKSFHIDPRRVYVTGISGGGRVSSMLQACLPDVFTGAVPIVGLSCYEAVPSGTGKFFPAAFIRPKPELFNLFKTRRIAPMTGRKDMNEIEMQQAAAILQRDGIKIKLFDDTKMGHEMPTPAQFVEALSWVDEPYQTLRGNESQAAVKALEAYTNKHGSIPPKDEASRRLLYKVMEAGPWTEAAWKAAEFLNAK